MSNSSIFSLYHFKNSELLTLALTHRSFGKPNNERLEWLGDSVLSFHVSQFVYDIFPEIKEGGLSAIRTRLVCENTLVNLARRIGLDKHLRIGTGQDSHNDKMLGDAMEAYIAAIYLDGGDIRLILSSLLQDDITLIQNLIRCDGICALRDSKSRLQEKSQHKMGLLPTYHLIKTAGKDNARLFWVECVVDEKIISRASGKSKIAAEQEAAALCLKQIAQFE